MLVWITHLHCWIDFPLHYRCRCVYGMQDQLEVRLDVSLISSLKIALISLPLRKHDSRPLSFAESELYRICGDNVGIVEDI